MNLCYISSTDTLRSIKIPKIRHGSTIRVVAIALPNDVASLDAS